MTSSKKAVVPAKSAGVVQDIAKPAMEPRAGVSVLKAERVGGALKLEAEEGQHEAINAMFGSTSKSFQDHAFGQVLFILSGGQKDGDVTIEVNTIFAMLEGIAPRDELEAMLAVQMMATHSAAMQQLSRHTTSNDFHQYEAYANLSAKFMRTFTMQMEALNRHRRGGKQIVEHVHVNAGGQAVIAGTVNTGSRG